MAEGHESRREGPSRGEVREGVSPSPGMGSGGVTPGKILKFETQSGAFWQEIELNGRSPGRE